MSDTVMLEKRMQETTERHIVERGYRTFNDIQVQIRDDQYLEGAFIQPSDWKATVNISANFEQAVTELSSQEKLDKDKDFITDSIVKFLIDHEIGHFKNCPRNRENFQRIINASFEVLESRETKLDAIKMKCFYIHNMFSDIIDNTLNSMNHDFGREYSEGLGYAYMMNNFKNDVLLKHIKNTGLFGKLKKYKMDKGFSLFLELNHGLCDCDGQFVSAADKYMPFMLGHSQTREKLMDIFTGNNDITHRLLERKWNDDDKAYVAERLRNESLWYQMARDFTYIIHRYISKNTPSLDNSFSGDSGSGQNSSGGGSGDKGNLNEKKQKNNSGDEDSKGEGEKQKKEGNDGENSDNNKKKDKNQGKNENDGSSSNDPFGEKKERKNGGNGDSSSRKDKKKKDAMTKRRDDMDKYISDLFKRRKNSDKDIQSPFLQMYEKLDELYTQRAIDIVISAEEENGIDRSMNLLLSDSLVSGNDFRMKNIEWSKTKIYNTKEGKKFSLYKKDMPESIDIAVEDKNQGIPDISFILDSSISMKFDPIAGTGEYHLAALAFYSILKSLEDKGLAWLLKYNMITFSKYTKTSGWCGYNNIDQVKKSLFNYQDDCTTLDPGALRDLRERKSDNFLCFMLTDCGFNDPNNAIEIHDEIIRMYDSGSVGFMLFNMGGDNAFARSLKSRNILVHDTASAYDFMDIAVKFSRELYGQVVKK